MARTFGEVSYKDVSDDLERTLDWLRLLGVQVNNTRVSTYTTAIRTLSRHYEAGTLGELYPGPQGHPDAPTFPEVVSAFFGVMELIAVHKELGSIQNPVLAEKLRVVVKGPLTPSAERQDSNSARNTLFELAIAARLASLGFAPRFDPPADIFIPMKNRRVVIECKRPQSLENLDANARKAFRQLQRRYEETSDPRTRGIIALDVSKAANPNFQVFSFKDDQAIADTMSGITDKVASLPIFKASRHRNTFGAIIKFSVMAVNQDQQRLTECQQFGFVAIPSRRAGDQQLVDEMAQRFSSVGGQRRE